MKEAGFSVRSRDIQTAFHSFIDEHDWKIDIRKKGAGTIVILFNNHTFYKHKMSTQLQHKYNDIISTTTHLHLDDDNCLETIMLKGKTKRIKELSIKNLRVKSLKIYFVSL